MSHEDSEKQTEHAHVAIVGCEGNVTNPILVFSHVSILLIKRSFLLISFFSDSFSFSDNDISSFSSFSFSNCLVALFPWYIHRRRIYRQRFLRIILIHVPNLYGKYLIIALGAPLFLMSLSVQTYPHFINKKKVQLRKTTGQLVFCQLFQKSSRGF